MIMNHWPESIVSGTLTKLESPCPKDAFYRISIHINCQQFTRIIILQSFTSNIVYERTKDTTDVLGMGRVPWKYPDPN